MCANKKGCPDIGSDSLLLGMFRKTTPRRGACALRKQRASLRHV